jgi:hypothetical protein
VLDFEEPCPVRPKLDGRLVVLVTPNVEPEPVMEERPNTRISSEQGVDESRKIEWLVAGDVP